MKKEIILAVIIGLVVGLLITYGIYTARQALKRPASNKTDTTTTSPSPVPTEVSTLIISSPADESIQTKKEVTIAGTTVGSSYIVVFVNDEEKITTADASGNFSVITDLQPGANIIRVHSLGEDGQETTAQRSVILSTSELTDAPSSSSSAQVSPTVTPKATASPKNTASPKVTASPKATASPTVKPASPKVSAKPTSSPTTP